MAGVRPERPETAAAHRFQPGHRSAGGGTMTMLRLLLACGLGIGLAIPAGAQTVAIIGGTVYPVSGPPIEGGTVLVRDGRIAAVGRNVAVPGDALRIDATGRWVTPGLIQTGTTLGVHLLDVGGQLETREDSLEGPVKPSFNVAEAIDPAAIAIPVA